MMDRGILDTTMRKADVFVQLQSKTPWKGVYFDHQQYESAKQANLPTYCFLGDIRTEQIKDTAHRKFLDTEGFFKSGYQDFKHHLQQELQKKLAERQAAIRKLQDGNASSEQDQPIETVPPTVRVAVKAGESQSIWSQVYRLLKKKHAILLDELGTEQSFITRQVEDPAEGFLILCDEKSLRGDSFSPTSALQQCRQIQIDLKGRMVPPVAVVFRTPPNAEEEEFIRCNPKCFSFVLDQDLEPGLAAFVQQVYEYQKVCKAQKATS
jgi:hypothetical protein